MTEQKKDKLTINSILYLAGIVISQGANVLMSPVYTRLLSAGDYGRNSIYMTLVSIFSVVVGLQTHGTLVLKHTEYEEEEYVQYRSNIMILSFLTFAVILCVSPLFIAPLSRLVELDVFLLYWSMIHSFGQFCVSFLLADLAAHNRSVLHSIFSVVFAVLSVTVPLILIYFTDYDRYVSKSIGSAIPYVIGGFVIFVLYVSKLKGKLKFEYQRFAFFYSAPLIFHGIGTYLLAQSDRVVIQKLVNSEVAGIYSLSYSLSLPTSALWTALNTSWNPTYAKLLAEEKYDEINKHIGNMIFTFTCASIGFLMCCPEFFKLMSTKDYWSGISIMPVIILSTYFVFLYSIPVNYQFLKKSTRSIAVITCMGTVINIVSNIAIIPKIGMIGAAFTTLIAWIFIWFCNDMVSRYRIGNFCFPFKGYLPGIFVMLAVSCLAMYIQDVIWIRYGIIVIVIAVYFARNKKIVFI